MEPLSVTRRIEASRQAVWDAMTDLETMPERISGITRIERLTPHTHVETGARWKETRTMFGRDATEEMVVTEADAPNRYVVESEGHGARYRSTFTFADADDATEVTMRFEAEPLTTVSKVLSTVTAPIARKSVQKAVLADLDDVARSLSR